MGFSSYYTIFLISLLVLHTFQGEGGGVGRCTTFTFVNKCWETIWPAILGSPTLETTGFQLPQGTSSRPFPAPPGWSGRFWARTGCAFDQSGHGSCATGDCGSGEMECNGAGATAATLAEFTLGPTDFYDVSLVDGYNLPLVVADPSGACPSTGCPEDLNSKCPAELRALGGGRACMSACGAFGTAEYCCKGEHGSPATCRPSVYSQIFKAACPASYTYAYDDATSTFTCTTADAYVITFCPAQSSPNKSSDANDTGGGSGSGSENQEAILADGSWLAALATGDSTTTRIQYSFGFGLINGSMFMFHIFLWFSAQSMVYMCLS